MHKISKVPFIQGLLNSNSLFIGLSETWLHNHVEAELAIENYTIFQSDNSTKKKSKRGRHTGGVALYLRNDIAATSSPLLTFSNGAVDIAAVYSSVENIVIAVVYRRPDDSTHNRPSNNNHFQPAIKALLNYQFNKQYT